MVRILDFYIIHLYFDSFYTHSYSDAGKSYQNKSHNRSIRSLTLESKRTQVSINNQGNVHKGQCGYISCDHKYFFLCYMYWPKLMYHVPDLYGFPLSTRDVATDDMLNVKHFNFLDHICDHTPQMSPGVSPTQF